MRCLPVVVFVLCASCVSASAPVALPWLDDASEPPSSGRSFVAVTYNLHSGLGGKPAWSVDAATARKHLAAMAATVASAAGDGLPDIVALNEIDFGSHRSGGIDEAVVVVDELERLTGVRYQIHRLVTWTKEVPGDRMRYGSALLSRHPVRDVFTCSLVDGAPCRAPQGGARLPPLTVRSLPMKISGERRGVLRATLDIGGHEVDVVLSHLEAFDRGDREAQAAHLLARFVRPGRSVVLLGDMNSVPQSFPDRGWFDDDRTHDVLTSGSLVDARLAVLASDPSRSPASFATFPSNDPVHAIDAVFASVDLVPVQALPIGGSASDHLGLLARFVRPEDAHSLAAAAARHDRMRGRQLHRLVQEMDAAKGSRRGELARFLVDATRFLEVASAEDRQRIVEALLVEEPGAPAARDRKKKTLGFPRVCVVGELGFEPR